MESCNNAVRGKGIDKALFGWLTVALLSLTVSGVFASGASPSDPFEIPQGAYSATFVEDRDHVSVMRFTGDYCLKLAAR